MSAVADGIASLRDQDYSVSVAAPETASALRSAGRRLQRHRPGPADPATGPVPARAAARHGDTGHAARAGADQRTRHGPVRQPRGAPGVRRRPQARGPCVRGAARVSAPRRCAPPSRRTATRCSPWSMHGESQVFHLSQRRFLLNGQPHRLLPAQAAHARAQCARGGDLEARDPRDRARDQQLGRADRLARAVRPATRAAPDDAQLRRVFGAIEERMAHLAGFVDGYSRFAKLPRPRPVAVALAGVHRAPAHRRAVRESTGALPREPRMVRRVAAAAGPAQSAQELSRGRIGRRRDHACRWPQAAAACCSSSSIAARA